MDPESENRFIYLSRSLTRMSLVKLIETHQGSLNVSHASKPEDMYSAAAPFAYDLLHLPSVAYTRIGMCEATARMLELGFERTGRCLVATYALRRAAVGCLPERKDVPAAEESDPLFRESAWDLLNLATLAYQASDAKARAAIRAGPKAKADFRRVKGALERLRADIHTQHEELPDISLQGSQTSPPHQAVENNAWMVAEEIRIVDQVLRLLP